MKRIFAVSVLSAFLLTGCSFPQSITKQVISIIKPQEKMYAKDFLSLTKLEITSLLGEKTHEEYYSGAMIYKFENSKMWFWFGTDYGEFDKIPDEEKCVYVMASLTDAYDFEDTDIDVDSLSDALNFDFGEAEYNEHDGIYMFSAEKDDISCIVSSSDGRTVSVANDYIIYQLN